MDKEIITVLVGLISMLLYSGLCIWFWIWLFFKSFMYIQDDEQVKNIGLDYTGLKSISFKKKCAYLYVRMCFEVITILSVVLFSSYYDRNKSPKDTEANKIPKLLWLGNRISVIFILVFSILGGILVSSITEYIIK